MNRRYSLKENIFRTFLKDQSLGPSEMATYLGANYNSVKAGYSKLCEEDLLKRVSRGKYSPNIEGIILHLMSRIESLEKHR
jgi:hypothetical protein